MDFEKFFVLQYKRNRSLRSGGYKIREMCETNRPELYISNLYSSDNIVTIRTDFQQGMESVSSFKINTVTENYWLIYAAASVIWPYRVGYYFQLS